MKKLLLTSLAIVVLTGPVSAANLAQDTVPTDAGELVITFVGHGSLVLEHGGVVVHVDPYAALADYAELPDADLVLITHHHGDHLDPAALAEVRGEGTLAVGPSMVCERLENCTPVANGERLEVLGLMVDAVPAYNLVHERSSGVPYHPRGEGNGYVVGFAGTRVYVAGDTENTPEMKALEDVDIAFLPMNLPYTMTPEMVADAASAFRPGVLYPYHYGDTDPTRLKELLADVDDVEVRIRSLR